MVCENQGAQGDVSYISPERMRRVSNCLGAWNVSEFIPHAFDYDLKRINFPPDWFSSQPFLPYFRSYADQMRRISFMNAESHHVAGILLYYPQVSIWGAERSCVQGRRLWLTSSTLPTGVPTRARRNRSTRNSNCASLRTASTTRSPTIPILPRAGLMIRRSSFPTHASTPLVLPPMSTIRYTTAQRVRDFYQAGGTVIAIGQLPLISAEQGRDDERLKRLWDSVFDTSPTLEL